MRSELVEPFPETGLRARAPKDIRPEEAREYVLSGEPIVYNRQLEESELEAQKSKLKVQKPVRKVQKPARNVPRPYIIRFFDFPPEIRTMIYNLIFVSAEPIGSNPSHTFGAKFPYREAAKWRNLVFAMSCRQIFDEASNIFFANNCFEFFQVYQVVSFLKKIGIEGRQQVRKLKLNYRDSDPKKAFKSIRMCPNITNLDIAIEDPHYSQKLGAYCEHYPIIDAKELIFGNLDEITLGNRKIFGGYRSQRLRQMDPKKALFYYSRFEEGLKAFKRSVVWLEKKKIREAAKQAVRSSQRNLSIKSRTNSVIRSCPRIVPRRR
jgi:hypothetical protein